MILFLALVLFILPLQVSANVYEGFVEELNLLRTIIAQAKGIPNMGELTWDDALAAQVLENIDTENRKNLKGVLFAVISFEQTIVALERRVHEVMENNLSLQLLTDDFFFRPDFDKIGCSDVSEGEYSMTVCYMTFSYAQEMKAFEQQVRTTATQGPPTKRTTLTQGPWTWPPTTTYRGPWPPVRTTLTQGPWTWPPVRTTATQGPPTQRTTRGWEEQRRPMKPEFEELLTSDELK